MKTSFIFAFLLLILAQPVSGIVVDSVNADSFSPGEQGTIEITLENNFNDDVLDVTLALDLTGFPFISVGSTSKGFDEVEADDDARATFVLKTSNDISPGNYQIPYTLTYIHNDEERTREGTIGIVVSAQPELSYTINTDNPVIGREGTINLRIVNTGFADAKFLSVKAVSNGFTILSEDQIYIGTVDSDDFETANFDVVFTSEKPRFSAIVEYTNFDNEKIINTIEIPVTVYTEERAIELGIIEQNNLPLYIGIVLALIIIWFIWRSISKRRRLRRSQRR